MSAPIQDARCYATFAVLATQHRYVYYQVQNEMGTDGNTVSHKEDNIIGKLFFPLRVRLPSGKKNSICAVILQSYYYCCCSVSW